MYRVVPVSDGIVLDTLKFDILKPSVVVHALLGPTPETPTHATLVFDLLWPPSMIHLSTEHPSRSWMSGRSDPATFPRLSHVRLISPHFPWMIDVKNNAGVTCGDVAQRISSFILQRVDKSEWDPLSQEDKAEIGNSYNWNRSTARGAPGGAYLPKGLTRVDFLGKRTRFAGIVRDDRFVKDRLGTLTGSTFVAILAER